MLRFLPFVLKVRFSNGSRFAARWPDQGDIANPDDEAKLGQVRRLVQSQ
jgi:hypothetical protein